MFVVRSFPSKWTLASSALKRNNKYLVGAHQFHSSSYAQKKRDFYDVLGVKSNASKSDIKKSYFNMAKKYHPDVNKEKGAEEKFREVSEAYEVLEDDKKRQMYDNYGHAGVDENMGNQQGHPFGGGFGGFGNGGVNVQWGNGDNMGGGDAQTIFDFFEQAFGGQGGGKLIVGWNL